MEQLPKQRAWPQDCPQSGRPERPFGEQSPRGGRHAGRPPHRRGGARLTAYFCIAVVLNLLLAVYALYAVGLASELSRDVLAAGARATVPETVYQILLLLSPVFLTVLLNRLLFFAMRGRGRRFPRWAVPVACVLILGVQLAAVLLLIGWFMLPAGAPFAVDTLTTLLP